MSQDILKVRKKCNKNNICKRFIRADFFLANFFVHFASK